MSATRAAETNEMYGENSCPDVPRGVGADIIASSKCPPAMIEQRVRMCGERRPVLREGESGERSVREDGGSEKRESFIPYPGTRKVRSSRTPIRPSSPHWIS